MTENSNFTLMLETLISFAIATIIWQVDNMETTTAPHINLEDFWPYQAVVLADQISRYTLSVVKAEAGLNLSQWRVLAAVAEKPGRTARDVTAITPMDKTIVSRAVASLIESDLIEKQASATDRRVFALKPTLLGLSDYRRIAVRLNETLGDGQPSDDFVQMLKRSTAKLKSLSANLA